MSHMLCLPEPREGRQHACSVYIRPHIHISINHCIESRCMSCVDPCERQVPLFQHQSKIHCTSDASCKKGSTDRHACQPYLRLAKT